MSRFPVFITPAADRSLRKLPHEIRLIFLGQVVAALARDPYAGYLLSEPFRGLRSIHFSASGQPYRAVYSVDAGKQRVIIHYVGYRGGFYERLRRMLE